MLNFEKKQKLFENDENSIQKNVSNDKTQVVSSNEHTEHSLTSTPNPRIRFFL